MVVQLTLILSLSIHLCHLFQRVEHGLNYLFIRLIHAGADLQVIGADELVLHAADVDREMFDKVSHAFPFLAGQLSLFDPLDLFILVMMRNVSAISGKTNVK